jgi:hypothetical protein
MPNDVKAILSVTVLIVAAILSYWSGSPIRQGVRLGGKLYGVDTSRASLHAVV